MERESLFKDRSSSSIIATAYKVQTDNIGRIIKASWLPVLLASLALSTLTAVLLPKSLPPTFSWLQLAAVVILGIGSIVLWVWSFSRVMSLLNEQSRKWTLKRSALLILNLILIYLVIEVVVGMLVAGAFWALKAKTAELMSSAWWIIGLLVLLLIVVVLPIYYLSMRYLDKDEMRFWKHFFNCYKRGLRYTGYIFLTLFMCGIIIGILMAVVYMPIMTLYVANAASFIGMMNGDAPDMPTYFPILFWVTALITHFVSFFVMTYEVIVCYLMYGSIEKQEEDRQKTAVATVIEEKENEAENIIHRP